MRSENVVYANGGLPRRYSELKRAVLELRRSRRVKYWKRGGNGGVEKKVHGKYTREGQPVLRPCELIRLLTPAKGESKRNELRLNGKDRRPGKK